jgi:hypothetical protein
MSFQSSREWKVREMALVKERNERTSSTHQMEVGIGVVHHLGYQKKKR